MRIWVLLRRAYTGDELLDLFGDRPDVLESVACAHPRLLVGSWVTISPQEYRLRDPRVDDGAGYNLIRRPVKLMSC